MYLYLFWLFPALIFLLFFMSDRRRLFNAYLFSINLGLLLLISAFLLVVRTELWFNQQIAIIVFVVISILVFLSIIFSSLFLLFNGRQMMLFEGKLIVSGGQGSDELIAEAEAMAGYLMEHGVPEDAILIENRSRTTFENLTFSKRILEEEGLGKRVLVVTNSFHALRAGVFMRRLKIPGRSIGSRTDFYYLPSAWIRETVGLVSLYWKWHVTFLALLFLPWFFTQIMKLIEFFIQHLN